MRVTSNLRTSCVVQALARKRNKYSRPIRAIPLLCSSSKWRTPLDRPHATGVNVERSCGALHDLLRDHDLLDALEAWQGEHRVKEYSLHDGAQPTRPGLAIDRLPGDGAECFRRHSEIDPLHLEKPLIPLHQCVLGLGQNELE